MAPLTFAPTGVMPPSAEFWFWFIIPSFIYLVLKVSKWQKKNNHILLPRFIGYLRITDTANMGNNLPVLKILPLHSLMALLLWFISTMFWGLSQQCFRVPSLLFCINIISLAHLDARPTCDLEIVGLTHAGSATFFHGDLTMKYFLPSADSRRAVVSFWWKNVHNWLTT